MQKNENMTRSWGLNVEKIDRELVSTPQFEHLGFKEQDVPQVTRPMTMNKMTCHSLVLSAEMWGIQRGSSKHVVDWIRGTLWNPVPFLGRLNTSSKGKLAIWSKGALWKAYPSSLDKPKATVIFTLPGPTHTTWQSIAHLIYYCLKHLPKY